MRGKDWRMAVGHKAVRKKNTRELNVRTILKEICKHEQYQLTMVTLLLTDKIG